MAEAPEDEEEVYLVPHDDGEVVFGTGEVGSTYVGLVDSGASFMALGNSFAKYLKNKRRGKTSVRDYTGALREMKHWSGSVNICVFDEQTQGNVQISGKALDEMEESLISTSHMCEKLGFTQVIRPVCEGRSYFEKTLPNGERIELPIQYLPSRRLYVMKFVITDSEQASVAALHDYRIMDKSNNLPAELKMMQELNPNAVDGVDALLDYVQRAGGNVFFIGNISQYDGLGVEEESAFNADVDDNDDDCDNSEVQNFQPSLVPPDVIAGTSPNQTISELFKGMESIPCRATSRPGLRKLSKQQMHDKLLHSGDVGECPICMTLRRGRSLQGNASRVMDPIVGRTWSMDAITWSNRGKDGEKLTVGAIDESSMFGLHFELATRTTAEVADGFIKMVKDVREKYGNDKFTRVNLDSAGEWSDENEEFHKRVNSELNPKVEFIYPPTMVDSRYNAHAEVWMRMIEEMTKAIMLTTRLEVELRPLATQYAVFMHNRTTKRSRSAPDGNGLRPIQAMSGFQISSEECDRQIDKSEMPGTLMLVKRKHGPKGSNINDTARWQWGRVMGLMSGEHTLVFEDPMTGVRFHGSDGVKVVLPPGTSALGYLGQEQPLLPKAAMPRSGDVEINETKIVIRLGELDIHDEGLTPNPITSMTAVGNSLKPGFIILDKNNRVMEPVDDSNYMQPTDTKLVAVKDPAHFEPVGPNERVIDYLTYMPEYFVGKTVFRQWKDGIVYRGTILDYDIEKIDGAITDGYLWRVKYDNPEDDNDFADYDAEDMKRWAINYEDGVIAGRSQSSVGAGGSVPDKRKIPGMGSSELPHADGSGDDGGVKENSLRDESVDDDEQMYITTGIGETWPDIMDELGIEDLDVERSYYDWISTEYNLGSNKQFNKIGGFNFPNPIRKREIKKLWKTKWPIMRTDLRFPVPEGRAWETFCNKQKCGLIDLHEENVETAKYLTELELQGVQCEVYLDFEVYKLLQKDEAAENLLEQISISELATEVGKEIDHAKLEEAQYYDEKGLPIAPKSVKALLKRAACKDQWFDAIKKEHQGLDKRGVLKYETMPEACKNGHISAKKKPIDIRLLLSTKIKPDGTFDKLKARAVVSGDQMIQGVHYSAVFTPTPSLTAGKIIQGLAVKDNLFRFGADVDQAFTAAEKDQDVQTVAVRMPEGMRKYNAEGQELYGILQRNLYGTPDAPLMWARCFSAFMHDEMGKEEGWAVEHMANEPCLWKVIIEGRITWMVVHVDDIDGAAQDPRDAKAILEKMQKKFGISVIEPKYMLGIQRDIHTDEQGVRWLEMSQAAYCEDAWKEWGHFRGTKKAPVKPADGLKFTDNDGNIIVPDAKEYEAVTKRGYRKLVGTLLWPARNAYPIISYAVVQLCRAMEKPSEKAWESCLHCLHYLYENRHEGIQFRSDASPIPDCYYDSGHLQDRVDYKSFYGYVIVFMGAPIHWVSKKHQHVGESSAEDEYMALNHAGKMVVWLRNLFKEMGLGELVSKPTLMLGDNKQACRWSRTEMVTNGNRFIERQYHKVREFILAGDLETRYINTKLNVSDVFTKDVSREVIEALGPMLTGRKPWPETPAADDAMKEHLAKALRENEILLQAMPKMNESLRALLE